MRVPIPKSSLPFPFNLPLLLWDACMFLTGNTRLALQVYHEMCAEILELIAP